MFITSGYSAPTRRIRSGTEQHHLGGDVLLGLRHVAEVDRLQAVRGGLLGKNAGRDAHEPHGVLRGAAAASRREEVADAVDAHGLAVLPDPDGLGDEAPAARLAD